MARQYYVSITEETAKEALLRAKQSIAEITDGKDELAIMLVHQHDEFARICAEIEKDKEKEA